MSAVLGSEIPPGEAGAIRAFAESIAREFEDIANLRVQTTPEQADTYREAAEHVRGRARYLTEGP